MPGRFGIFGKIPRAQSQCSEYHANEPCVKAFKGCVEEVRNEHPDLAAGAVNQIAMQRFQSRRDETVEKRAPNVLDKCLSRFRLVGGVHSSDNSLLPGSIRSEPSDADMQIDMDQSFAPRRTSTVMIDEEDFLHHDSLDSHLRRCDSENALAKSLSNIESENYNCRRMSMRSSGILSEYEEGDEELDGLSFNSGFQKRLSDAGESKDFFIELQGLKSGSDPLGDARTEFQVSNHVEGDSDDDMGTRKPRKHHSLMPRYINSSVDDLQSLDDEQNFRGDFSAWRRFSRNSRSSRRSSRRESYLSETSAEGDEGSFRAFMGDFSGWSKRRTSLTQN